MAPRRPLLSVPSRAISSASTSRWSSASRPTIVSAISPFTLSDRLLDTLADVAVAAVAQLDRLVLAGRRAGRHDGAADGAAVQTDHHLDGGVATRIEDLAPSITSISLMLRIRRHRWAASFTWTSALAARAARFAHGTSALRRSGGSLRSRDIRSAKLGGSLRSHGTSALRRSGGSLRSRDIRSPPLGRLASLTGHPPPPLGRLASLTGHPLSAVRAARFAHGHPLSAASGGSLRSRDIRPPPLGGSLRSRTSALRQLGRLASLTGQTLVAAGTRPTGASSTAGPGSVERRRWTSARTRASARRLVLARHSHPGRPGAAALDELDVGDEVAGLCPRFSRRSRSNRATASPSPKTGWSRS